MERNKSIKMLLITALIVMIALILVSSTYAKYTSSTAGTDVARVAKWSFKVGNNDIVAKDTFSFNLFDTITDSNGTSEENDVVSANSDKVIAPGTSGSFSIELKNESETSAKYGITYTVTNTANIPVQFSVDEGKTWTNSLSNVDEDDVKTKIAPNTGTKTIKIQWKWAYENTKENASVEEKKATDDKDLELGKEGTAILKVQADVTATQID